MVAKTKVTMYQPLIQQQKTIYLLYIANKTECSSFKSGCVLQVTKHLIEDWLVVLR